MLKVGRVTRAHGLRGEVVVQLWTDQAQRLHPGSVLSSAQGPLRVTSSTRMGEDRYLVQFAQSTDRTTAESLRGTELEAEPLSVPGTLWVHELVGATVFDVQGTRLGVLAAVEANPASDLLVLESGGLIPARFVTRHDPAARTVEVDIPDGLLDA
ncbi:MAG: 16S rRNA processing protein RimM [Acidimicrobiales bacterium]|nr:16S rRNA processing protein RimM [Acidimicrobiales bacterium]